MSILKSLVKSFGNLEDFEISYVFRWSGEPLGTDKPSTVTLAAHARRGLIRKLELGNCMAPLGHRTIWHATVVHFPRT